MFGGLQTETAMKGPSFRPDPFSRLNFDLVREEVWREEMCPCCLDRLAQIELNKAEAAWGLEPFDSYAYTDALDARYFPVFGPNCGSRFCFCSECMEAEASGCGPNEPKYEEWRRAFPELPW